MLRGQLSKILSNILVITCCVISIVLSVIESRVNNDSHHWGLMYSNATDLNQGLVPYKEIFIQYGFLTTLIHSFALKILGNTIVSIGIITGIFYALSIYLCYLLWQKFLNKWQSCLSTILMFLVHGYIILPWANYFSYTFFLISLLFLTASPQKSNRYLLAGLFSALSYLARQSPIPILVPIYLYFWLLLVDSKPEEFKVTIKNIVMFHIGLLSLIGIFLLYLVQQNAFSSWITQSFTIISFYNSTFGGTKKILFSFLRSLILAEGYPKVKGNLIRDLRLLLYSLIFINTFIVWIIIFLKGFKKQLNQINEGEKILFLFSSVVLFGYLNSLHLYEVFRLQNASSLGFGLLLKSLDNFSEKFKRYKPLLFNVPIIFILIILSSTLIYSKTSSVYTPWNQKLLFSNQLKEPENIEIFQGKLYDQETRNYYETLSKSLNKYSSQLKYIVNLTRNSTLRYLSASLKSPQIIPFYSKELSEIVSQDEQEKIARLLSQEKAIIVATKSEQIPQNYHVVLEDKIPSSFRPYAMGSITYIAVPKKIP